MESVGQKLRDARLRLGSALEEISAATRISLKNLRAIEDDDLTQISSPFLYRSFVRQFAASVNLETDEDLLRTLQKAAESMPEPLVPGQEGAPAKPDLPGLRPQRTRKLRWILSLVSLVLILAACSSVYGMWQTSRDGAHHSLSGFLSSLKISQPRPAPSSVQPAAAATVPQPRTDSPTVVKGPETLESAAGFRIQLSAVEATWLSVVADGKQVYQGVLRADESKTLEGRESARVRTGNAGGVEVVFNGRDIGPLGRKGQVRTVVFTKSSYEVLTSQVSLEQVKSDWALHGRGGLRLLGIGNHPVSPFQATLLSFKNN